MQSRTARRLSGLSLFSFACFLTAPRALAQPVSTTGTSVTPAGSTSGASVTPALTAPPAPAESPPLLPPAASGPSDRERALENRVHMLETRLVTDEQIEKEQAESMAWLRRIKISGFVQPQFVLHSYNTAASPNLLATGGLPAALGPNDVAPLSNGTTTNGTYFTLRRAFLKVEFAPTHWARFVAEIDAAPLVARNTGGIIAREIQAVGFARLTRDIGVEYSLGMFRMPFGFEAPESDGDRAFIEHSWGHDNMFPGDYDTGARVAVVALDRRLQATAAIVNGQTIGEKNFAVLPDANHGKDGVARVTYDFGPIRPGVSGYYGQGQSIDGARLRFKQFPRWAVDLELTAQATFVECLGKTRFVGELVRGQNMDRGTLYAFAPPQVPENINADVVTHDELSAYARVEQDLTRHATLGLRYDYYSPDTAQSNNQRHTFGVVGVLHIARGLQAMIEYDRALDKIHPAGLGETAARQYDTFSGVLQAKF